LRVAAPENVTHLVWATGGGMVPEAEMEAYLAKGR
jgi:D-serine dehydratase